MPESVLGALARLELALHEWEPMPEEVLVRLEALRASLLRWPNRAQLTVLAPSHGRWVRTVGGTVIDLSRRRALRRLVDALIDARIHRPGQPLTSSELIAAGWPDERLVGEVSLNRLYVALTRLRQLGLMDILMSASDGWLISPTVRIERPAAVNPDVSRETTGGVGAGVRRDSEIRVLASPPSTRGDDDSDASALARHPLRCMRIAASSSSGNLGTSSINLPGMSGGEIDLTSRGGRDA